MMDGLIVKKKLKFHLQIVKEMIYYGWNAI